MDNDFDSNIIDYALGKAANKPAIAIDEINEYIQMSRELAKELNLTNSCYFNASEIDNDWAKKHLKAPYFEIDDNGRISSPAYDETSFYRGFGKRPERVLKAFSEGIESGQTEKVFMTKEGRVGQALTYPTSANIDAVAVIDTKIQELPGFKDEEVEVTFKGKVPREYVKKIFMSRPMYETVISRIFGKGYAGIAYKIHGIQDSYSESGKPKLIPVDGDRTEYGFILLKKLAETNYSQRAKKNAGPIVFSDKPNASVIASDAITADKSMRNAIPQLC